MKIFGSASARGRAAAPHEVSCVYDLQYDSFLEK
jgi:hypothetical protein